MPESSYRNLSLTGRFVNDLQVLKDKLGENSDVTTRLFYLNGIRLKAALFFIEGLTDKEQINNHVLKKLMEPLSDLDEWNLSHVSDLITYHVLSLSDITEERNIDEIKTKILSGSSALLIEGEGKVLILGTKKVNGRSIEEPISEALVRGPRVGFTESLNENSALLRGMAENKDLTLYKTSVGNLAKKEIMIAYVNGIANQDLIDEVKTRINKIKIDYAAESGYIEEIIEDNFLSPFPQLQSTERPDRVMGAIMEGRVAILLDGSPFALIAPVTFSMLFQSPEDYYERWMPGSLLRVLRYLAAFLSLLGPALYISFISFHPGLIPTKLAMSIAGSREGVPFPAIIEALIMEVSIEILREAGLRLPKPIGPAIGIVGGLIIGEAAVQAGIVSSIMVIVVALTAISSFAIPQYSVGITLRLLRFVAMFCAAIFGLYGVVLFFLLLCSHLVRLESFGVPYTSPVVPLKLKDLKDFIIRAPIFLMKRRPSILHPKDPVRK